MLPGFRPAVPDSPPELPGCRTALGAPHASPMITDGKVHQPQRRSHPDLDSTHCDPPAEVPAVSLPAQLGSVQSGGPAEVEPLHLRDLWNWLDNPFETPPVALDYEQLSLDLAGIGQH